MTKTTIATANPLQLLVEREGTYYGEGVNHEGQKYRAELTIAPRFDGKGVVITARATGETPAGTDKPTVFHEEHSVISHAGDGRLGLWVMSTNHMGVAEHWLAEVPAVAGAERTLAFAHGNAADRDTFREIVSFDLWPNGDVTHRYAWGMPGGVLEDRSSARMTHGKHYAVPRARMKETEHGLVPDSEGWYVLNARDSAWGANERFGEYCTFEGKPRFEQYGINVHVLQPGQPSCHYHGEDDQENFLVLSGQCKLLIEGQEVALKDWDFVHCPKWAKHVFVGAGTGPCTILMVGGRTGHGVIYPVTELAQKHRASAPRETMSPKESYADAPKGVTTHAPARWPL